MIADECNTRTRICFLSLTRTEHCTALISLPHRNIPLELGELEGVRPTSLHIRHHLRPHPHWTNRRQHSAGENTCKLVHRIFRTNNERTVWWQHTTNEQYVGKRTAWFKRQGLGGIYNVFQRTNERTVCGKTREGLGGRAANWRDETDLDQDRSPGRIQLPGPLDGRPELTNLSQ